jgi:hypothetical protein
MNKNLKLGLGVALLGTAIFLIYKQSKDKKAKASQDPICKDGEELVTEMLNVPCTAGSPSNCGSFETKVCKPIVTSFSKVKCNDGTEDIAMSDSPCIDNGGIFIIYSKQNDDIQAERFNGY